MLTVTTEQVLTVLSIAFGLMIIVAGIFLHVITKQDEKAIEKRRQEDNNSLEEFDWGSFKNQF